MVAVTQLSFYVMKNVYDIAPHSTCRTCACCMLCAYPLMSRCSMHTLRAFRRTYMLRVNQQEELSGRLVSYVIHATRGAVMMRADGMCDVRWCGVVWCDVV